MNLPYLDAIRREPFYPALTALDYVDKIHVYGSYSYFQGSVPPSSDLDLAITCPRASDEEWRHIVHTIQSAPTLITVDPIRRDRMAQDAHFMRVKSYGSLLFTRHPPHPLEMMEEYWPTLLGDLPILTQSPEILPQYHHIFHIFLRCLRRAFIAMGKRSDDPVTAIRLGLQKCWLQTPTLWNAMLADWLLSSEPLHPTFAQELETRIKTYTDPLQNAVRTLYAWYEGEIEKLKTTGYPLYHAQTH